MIVQFFDETTEAAFWNDVTCASIEFDLLNNKNLMIIFCFPIHFRYNAVGNVTSLSWNIVLTNVSHKDKFTQKATLIYLIVIQNAVIKKIVKLLNCEQQKYLYYLNNMPLF